MNRHIQNGKLVTDLDADGFRLVNPGDISGSNLVEKDDPRLSDRRPVINGTVTNDSVSNTAEIDQSKLSLNGALPSNFLGTTDHHAAQGDLVQPAAGKNAASGYPGLDGSGRIPVANFPPLSGSGTVKSVEVVLPDDFTVDPPKIQSGAGTIGATWDGAQPESWFGNRSGGSAQPGFKKQRVYTSLVPALPASKITTGVFPRAMLPVAATAGATSNQGLVPDPGALGDPDDYLGRDMIFHPMVQDVSYQPKLSNPAITIQNFVEDKAYISVTHPDPKVIKFYRIDSSEQFAEESNFPVTVLQGVTVDAYVARDGYNNSDIVSYTIPIVSEGII